MSLPTEVVRMIVNAGSTSHWTTSYIVLKVLLGRSPSIYQLIHDPDLQVFGHQSPIVVLELQRTKSWETPVQSDLTIAMPIFNAADVLPYTLPSLLQSSNGSWELVLV